MCLKCVVAIIFWILLEAQSCPEDGCAVQDETLVSCGSHINLTSPEIRTAILCGFEDLDLDEILGNFPNVQNVKILRSSLDFSTPISRNNEIKRLCINKSILKSVGEGFLSDLRKLEVLDLRNNSLTRLPVLEGLKEVYLEGNKWNCSQNIAWAIKMQIKDSDKIKCHGEPYPDKPLLVVSQFLKIDCPKFCECRLAYVVRRNSRQFQPIIEADCSDRNLTSLPAILPEFTKIVRLDNNRIGDLSPLISNPTYKNVLDLYLDNNEVRSVRELEGAYWLAHFRKLSLSGNKLTQLPTYAFDNALNQNPNMPGALTLFLGGNPWRCDCVFTPGFQEMLMKYGSQVADLGNIRCAKVKGDANSLQAVVSLTRSSVCRPPSEYSIRPLDLVNIILASLIVLILGKLAYDYYYFKRTGRLPWIITKLP